jgi:hypothetical protein
MSGKYKGRDQQFSISFTILEARNRQKRASNSLNWSSLGLGVWFFLEKKN